MSRYIAHKIKVDTANEDGVDIGDAKIDAVELTEQNEIAHCREGEEREFDRAVQDAFEELEDDEALVLHRVVF